MTPAPGTARPDDGRWTRRGLLAAAAAAGGGVLAACTVDDGRAAPTLTATATVTAEPAPTVTVTAAPGPSAPPAVLGEQPVPWTAVPGEVLPECKQAAADFVVAAMSFQDRGRDDGPLAERLAPLGVGADVAQPLMGLLPSSGPGALQVHYSQYGGLGADEKQASQMVVGEQLLLDPAGALVRRPFIADVRLSLDGGRWRVTAVVPAYPDPSLPPLTPAVQALLGDARVELTGACAADLRAGIVQEPVAAGLLQLAEGWRIRVHVFRTGHPANVWGTTRPSTHGAGRAVDVTALDGIPVIEQGLAPWRAFMEAAAGAGATNIGGPAEPTPTGPYFTDRVHQDHVHLAFPPA